jgi:hypothetical protein
MDNVFLERQSFLEEAASSTLKVKREGKRRGKERNKTNF